MSIITTEQEKCIATLVMKGYNDFDIAQQVCPAGDNPEFLLEGVSDIRDQHECAQLG